jgi:putative transposase
MDVMAQPKERGLPVRRYPAHPSPVERSDAPIIVLVTVCTLGRAPLLANACAHAALVAAWREADDWAVGSYVVMPDHVHVFCSPAGHCVRTVKDWAAYWKGQAGERLSSLRGAFQRDCWDTQMRTRGHYCRKLEYVKENPVRRGLVATAGDWRYAGRLNGLWW